MYLRKYHFLFLIIILSSSFTLIHGQRPLSEINLDRELVENSLKFTFDALNSSGNSDLNDEYLLLNNHIENTEKLSLLLSEEFLSLQMTLRANRTLLDSLNLKIPEGKKRYIEILKMLYRQKLVKNDWLYFLSSESLNNAIIKYRYIKQYETFAKNENAKLKALQYQLSETNELINQQLIQLEQNKNKQERILLDLQEEQERKKSLIADLKNDQEKVAKKIKSDALVKQKSRNTITQKDVDPFSLNSDKNEPISNSDSFINSSFDEKKGNLKWPVDQGIIIEKFGRRPHDVVRNIWIENNGIGIRTSLGENIKAVYKGIVRQTPKIDDTGYMIIIEHGSFLTSYFSIATIFVQKGDEVNEGQIIGQLSQSPTTSPSFNFEIWKGYDKLNPEDWLIKK